MPDQARDSNARIRILRSLLLDSLSLLMTSVIILGFYAPRFSPHASFVLGDGLEQNVPHRVYATLRIQQGHLPEWSDMTFGGYPFLSDPQTAVFFPPYALMELAGWIPDTSKRFDAVALGFVLFAGLGATALARAVGVARVGAIAAGVFFALNGYMVNHLSHTVITSAIAALVWGMFFLVLAIRHEMRRAWWAAALCLGASVLAGHWQTAMFGWYATAVLGLYLAITKAWRARSLKSGLEALIGCGVVFSVAALVSLVQVLPTLEFLQHSTREKLGLSDALVYSLPLKQITGLLMPGLYQPLFWRIPPENRWELCWRTWGIDGGWEFHFWVGIVAVAFMLFGLFTTAKRPSSWCLAGALVFTLIASMGEDFGLYRWLFFHVPGFRQIRIPPRMLWVGYLAAALLLGRGIASVASLPRWPWRKWGSIGTLSVLVALVGILAYIVAWSLFLTGDWASALEMLLVINPNYRIGVHRSLEEFLGDIRAQAFVGGGFLACAMIWLWLAGRLRSRSWVLGPIALVLLTGELTIYGLYKNIRTDSAGFDSAVTPMHALLGESISGRLHAWSPGPWEKNTGEVSGIPMTWGYNPMILRWTHRSFPPEEPTHGWRSRENVLDVWNVSHVAVPTSRALVRAPGFEHDLELVAGMGGVYLARGSDQLSSAAHFRVRSKELAAVVLVTSAMGVVAEVDGTTVGLLSLLSPSGGEITSFPLRLGQETAEWVYFAPELNPKPAHSAPPVAYTETCDFSSTPTTYFLARFELAPTTAPICAIRIQSQLDAPRWFSVSHVIEVSKDHGVLAHPAVEALGYEPAPSRDPAKWLYFRRPRPLGWAWLVPEALPVSYKSDLRFVRELLDSPTWDPQRTVLVDKKGFETTETVTAQNARQVDNFHGKVEIEHPYPELWRIRTKSNDRGWLVISKTWYRGWRGIVDGREVPPVRANGSFTALAVPEGEHLVELRYATPWLWVGAPLSAAGWLIALFLGLVGGWAPWIRYKR